MTLYNEDYYERGAALGISGYMNYSWMPEFTLRMAHYLVSNLGIKDHHKILDFGCAKGYLVHALRILDYKAYGVDVSEYALSKVPVEVQGFCAKTQASDIFPAEWGKMDWLISKDVFEHIAEDELEALLVGLQEKAARMLVVVPLGKDDTSGEYVIESYNSDITHIIAKTAQWWSAFFESAGWTVEKFSHQFKGIKENWLPINPKGNGFFWLKS